MQDLAGVRLRGNERVVAAHAGVAEPGTLLLRAEHLANERIDVDHELLACRTRPDRPRARERSANTRSS